jgi:hypothetical protein
MIEREILCTVFDTYYNDVMSLSPGDVAHTDKKFSEFLGSQEMIFKTIQQNIKRPVDYTYTWMSLVIICSLLEKQKTVSIDKDIAMLKKYIRFFSHKLGLHDFDITTVATQGFSPYVEQHRDNLNKANLGSSNIGELSKALLIRDLQSAGLFEAFMYLLYVV